MTDEELIVKMRTGSCGFRDLAADRIEELKLENTNLKIELCLKCGQYKQAHNGACDGCRYK